MRAIVALLFVAVTANALIDSQEYHDEVKDVHEDCLNESKCDKDILKKHYLERNVDDPKLRKYLMCVSKKLGYRDDAGEYQPEAHKKALLKIINDEGKVNEIMKKCVIKKETPEESVLISGRCFVEEMRTVLLKSHKEKLETFVKVCKTETSVSEDALEKMHEGKELDDSKLKDFAFCMMKHFGTMSEEGELNMDIIKADLYFKLHDSDSVKEITDKCCKQKASPKETAYHHVLCKFQNIKI